MNYSILDASNDFADLSNKIGRFKEKLCTELKIDLRSQDFRLVFLDSIQQFLLSLTSYIRAFMGLQEKVSSPEEFLRILNIGINTVEQFERSGIIYKFPIQSLVTMIHFQIDSFLGEICAQSETPHTGFYKRMKCVLDATNIEREQKEHYKNTLQCLAFFRNSFHNAGYHKINKMTWPSGREPSTGAVDREFSIGEFKIEFKHNELIVYNWKNIHLLIENAVSAMQSIIMAIYEKE